MSAQITRLSGDDWQYWANQLLARHYGSGDYQVVPDNDKGDAGIEGFVVSRGLAYQAYGCEEPVSTQARYEKQRNKMTDDIKKFINNKVTLARLFGNIKIQRWILFVPHFDSKDIVAHATTKTNEVLDANLPYVDNAFRVMVSQEEEFRLERNKLIEGNPQSLKIKGESPSDHAMQEWALNNTTLTTTLDAKLQRLPTLGNAEARNAFKDKVLRWYLEGQSMLEQLRDYPELHEKVLEAKSHRENLLAMSTVMGVASADSLGSALTDYRKSLEREVTPLHVFSAEMLAFEAVSDWLLRCPLDFPGV